MAMYVQPIFDEADAKVALHYKSIVDVSEIRGIEFLPPHERTGRTNTVLAILSTETIEKARLQGSRYAVFRELLLACQRRTPIVIVDIDEYELHSARLATICRCFPFLFDQYVPISFATMQTVFSALERDISRTDDQREPATFAGKEKTNYEECFAKHFLESWKPKRYMRLSMSGRTHSPDLIAEDYSVGIEVTNAMPAPFIHKLNNIALIHSLPPEKVGRYLSDWVKHYAPMDSPSRAISFRPENVVAAIERKTNKLNSKTANYAKTEKDELFIFHDVPVLTNGRWKALFKAIRKEMAERERYYTGIYVYCSDALYIYSIDGKRIDFERIPSRTIAGHIASASEKAYRACYAKTI